MFSKPFLFSLSGHSDGISTLKKSYNNISKMISGSFNGEIILWDISLRKMIYKIDAFQN
jgi:WD repeat and SOF domain-containing protein 1